jgi:pimeloyl-ACP methyl ester carboxylesterase
VQSRHLVELRSIDYLGAMKALRHGLALPLLGLVAAALCAPPAHAAVRIHSCDLGAKRPLRCGKLTVPLRRGDPSQGSTRIAFAVRPRTDRRRPSLGTILATDGGPGYASTDAPFLRSLSAVLAPLLRHRELVFVDARGTGRSAVIDCPSLQGGLIQEDVAIGQCADRLGPRYAAYTTAETASDLDAVRRALGVGRVYFYGDSYATLLGQAYAARYPARLRGLILDSAYPGDDPYYRTLLPAGRRALNLACRNSPACGGNAVARFARVVRRFHARSRSTEGLIRFLLGAGTLAPRSYLGLDDGTRRFLHGDPRRLERLIAPGPAGHGDLGEFSYGLEIAVECNDYPLLWDPRAPIGGRIEQLTAATRKLPADHFAPFGSREYLLSPAAHLTNCLTWPAPPAGGLEPPVPPGWRAPRSFPTLILAGQLDDITSVAEARQVQARFPRSRLYVVPNRGHSSSLYFPFRSPAVGAIRGFLRRN